MKAKFYTPKGRSAYIPIIIGFLIIVSPFVAIYLDPDDQFSFSFSWLALIPIGIFGFFTYVLLSASFKIFTTYTISTEGIRIYSPPFHFRLFSMEQIEEVKVLSAEETRKLIELSMMEQNSYGQSGDIIGYFRMIRTKSPAYRYFTNSASAKVTTAGLKETIISLDLKSSGGSIMVRFKNGEEFYLTPDHPERFSMVFKNMSDSRKNND